MQHCFVTELEESIPIHVVTESNYSEYCSQLSDTQLQWLNQNNFTAKTGTSCSIPSVDGAISEVVVAADMQDMWSTAQLVATLPPLSYAFANQSEFDDLHAIAWGLASYRFANYKETQDVFPRLMIHDELDVNAITELCASIYLIRDLINTPASDMGPEALAANAQAIAKEFSAEIEVIYGEELTTEFPLIHTVGRAAEQGPRLVDIKWENEGPNVTLVGKGVCFDTGGLDLKNAAGMLLMKKDMAGAAHALGLARLIMALDLPINLRVLLPIVENSVAGNAYRPGDILTARNGRTVEIGNTDAEGRLILADALSFACEDEVDYLIDFASLTGAARIAVGTDMAAMFCNQQEFANEVLAISQDLQDPIWQMPLFKPYRKLIDSPFADLSNTGSAPYGGAITAALFLQDFIDSSTNWMHFDIMAWNLSDRAGRPQGGEAMGIRTMIEFLKSIC